MAKEYTVVFPQEQFTTLSNLLQLIVVAGLEFHGSGDAIPTKEQLSSVWRTIITATISDAQNSDRASELEYLRFYAEKVYHCLGPADDDIVSSIKEQFVNKTGKKLPHGYDPAEEEV